MSMTFSGFQRRGYMAIDNKASMNLALSDASEVQDCSQFPSHDKDVPSFCLPCLEDTRKCQNTQVNWIVTKIFVCLD
jgi:hypothetical protein